MRTGRRRRGRAFLSVEQDVLGDVLLFRSGKKPGRFREETVQGRRFWSLELAP